MQDHPNSRSHQKSKQMRSQQSGFEPGLCVVGAFFCGHRPRIEPFDMFWRLIEECEGYDRRDSRSRGCDGGRTMSDVILALKKFRGVSTFFVGVAASRPQVVKTE
jgi:hypothetical protein